MKTYLADIIPKIQQHSKKLDDITLLTNQHWVVIDEAEQVKCVYIFRTNKELLISRNGIVEKAKWEYLDGNSLLIDTKNESYLFKHGFFDDTVLALKLDSKAEYALFVNESKSLSEYNSAIQVINFLSSTYSVKALEEKTELPQPLNVTDDFPISAIAGILFLIIVIIYLISSFILHF